MNKKKLIFGIDASRSAVIKSTGVERYSTEIISALLDLYGSKFEIRLYTPKQIPIFPEEKQKIINMPRFWSLIGLSNQMLMNKPDILFVPAHVLPFFAPKKSFVTIHDIAFEKHKKAYGVLQRIYLQWSTKRAINKADKIFVPSLAVKKDLIQIYECKEEKIIPIAHGPLKLVNVNIEDCEEILNKYGLKKTDTFFFFLGRIELKKNINILLEAWKVFSGKNQSSKLFLGGSFGMGSEEIKTNSNLIMPGYITEKEVSALLKYAKALILPSIDEGFGLPILQAFSANCPVICSNIEALREVGADSVLYANPQEAHEFAEQMQKLIDNPNLREEMIEKGKERLKNFDWKKSAEKIGEFL